METGKWYLHTNGVDGSCTETIEMPTAASAVETARGLLVDGMLVRIQYVGARAYQGFVTTLDKSLLEHSVEEATEYFIRTAVLN